MEDEVTTWFGTALVCVDVDLVDVEGELFCVDLFSAAPFGFGGLFLPPLTEAEGWPSLAAAGAPFRPESPLN
ncbi:MAG TPA: hypothetical protein VEI07_15550 [Planctomycetaceae bacterium]|nr:hypothetical protein [Planctomycetaceae bacterium]